MSNFDKAMKVLETGNESEICEYFGVPDLDSLIEALEELRNFR